MSSKSSNSRKKTAVSLFKGRRNIYPGSFGNVLTGKKNCRKRIVAVNRAALEQTKGVPAQPILLTGRMRPQVIHGPGPYEFCSCGSGRKVKWCATIGVCNPPQPETPVVPA
jgi:hypothetical protein